MNRQTRESKPGFRLSFTYNRSIPIWGRGAPFVPAPRYKHVDDYICTEMHWKVQRTQRSQMCMIQCVIHTNVFVQIKLTIVASASRFRMNALWVNSGAFLLWIVVQLSSCQIHHLRHDLVRHKERQSQTFSVHRRNSSSATQIQTTFLHQNIQPIIGKG